MSDMITRPAKMEPAHPGAILARVLDGDENHAPVSVTAAAKALGVSRQTLHRLLAKQIAVSPEMAIRVGTFVGNGPGLWLRMQAAYDLWHAEHDRKVRARVAPIASLRAAAPRREPAKLPIRTTAKRARRTVKVPARA